MNYDIMNNFFKFYLSIYVLSNSEKNMRAKTYYLLYCK